MTLIFTVPVSASDKPPELPHRVYGEITDSGSSEPVEGLDVSFRDDSEVFGQASTDSDGFYDIRLSGPEKGDEVFLFIQDENRSEHISYTAGSSERIDYSGDFNAEGSDEDEENNGSDDSESSDSDDDSSDDGGTSGGGGGGGGVPPSYDEDGDEDEGEEGTEEDTSLSAPNTKSFDIELDGYTEVDVGSLESGQRVIINIEDTDERQVLKGLAFTAEEDTSQADLTLADSDAPLSGVSISFVEDVYGYLDIEISGIREVSDTELGLTVDSTWIDSRDRNPGELRLAGHMNSDWQRIDLSYLTQDLEGYRYDAQFMPGDFAVYLPDQEEQVSNIQVDSIEVNRIENSSRVRVEASISNSGNSAGEEEFILMANGEEAERYTASLGAGDSAGFTFETDIREDTSFSMGGKEVTAETSQSSTVIYLLLAGVILLIAVIAVVLKYLSEQRKAKKMEKQLKGLRTREENVEARMKSLRQNVDNLRRKMQDS